MTAKYIFATGLLVVLSSATPVLPQATPAKPSTVTAPIPAPNDRARQWMTLVDDGNYAQSWNEAGSTFKSSQTTAAAWAKEAAAEA